MLRKNHLFAGAAVIILAGCTNLDVNAVRGMSTTGGDFNKALHKEYVQLAADEAAEFDWGDVSFFNTKASAAAGGAKVGPQAIADRDIPANAMGGLTSARASLVKALGAGGGAKAPQHAARAQAAFDCWLQEQEENFQPPDIARCRANFDDAMKKLASAMAPKVAAARPAPRRPARPARPKPPPLTQVGPFVVYFDFNKSSLNAEAKAIVANAVTAANIFKAKSVEITGHADRSGTSGYNDELARTRSLTVARALGAGKVRPSIMNITSLGEAKPMVATPDGKRERQNRRVEILIKR